MSIATAPTVSGPAIQPSSQSNPRCPGMNRSGEPADASCEGDQEGDVGQRGEAQRHTCRPAPPISRPGYAIIATATTDFTFPTSMSQSIRDPLQWPTRHSG
ncbi:hypothetical protein ACJBU6_02460 [Exserohilum turcicum]